MVAVRRLGWDVVSGVNFIINNETTTGMDVIRKMTKELLEAQRKINSYPVGFVMSCEDLDKLRDTIEYAQTVGVDKDPIFWGVPIYDFADVPNGKILAFKNREHLQKYLKCREEGKSHLEAFASFMAEWPLDRFPDPGFNQ